MPRQTHEKADPAANVVPDAITMCVASSTLKASPKPPPDCLAETVQNGRFENAVPKVIVHPVTEPVSVTSPELSELPEVTVGVPQDDTVGGTLDFPSDQ